MGATAVNGWPWPELTPDPAHGPEAFSELALAVEASLNDKTWTTYTPTWTGDTTNPTGGTLYGRYRREGKWCDVAVCITFGASVNGGSGSLRVLLPVTPAAAPPAEQLIDCKLHLPQIGSGRWYRGAVSIYAGNNYGAPLFNETTTNANVVNWRNADASGAISTGIPLNSGTWGVWNGGSFTMTGRYLTV